MTEFASGALAPGSSAPDEGEAHDDVVTADGFRVEQVRSGYVSAPVEFIQAHDEWAIVIEGSATIEVANDRIELEPGRWVLLPAGVPHRLLRVEPGTSWVAVHADPLG